MNPTPAMARACLHCGEPALIESKFCCAGCESVYTLLESRGLSHYYELRGRYAMRKPPAARVPGSQAFPESMEAKLYIEGIHCLGCLWILEKLHELDSRIISSGLNLAHHTLAVRIDEKISWREVSELLSRLGYAAQFVEENDAEKIRRQDHRRQLWRVALAGFSAGNVMLLSVAVYAGADGWWAGGFGWLSLALAAPCLLYSAWPIYRSALSPLRLGRLSVDLAIALALLAGAAMSLWSLLRGDGQVYFDSLTMLVFLLLSSRYALSRMQESLAQNCLSFLGAELYEVEGKGLIKAEVIEAGDRFTLSEGQTVPADSRLLSPSVHCDLSLLTGESLPEKFHAGDTLESGTKSLTGRASFQALRAASESRLAKILSQIQSMQSRRSESVEFADRLGRWFVIVVLSVASVVLLRVPGEEGLQRALALVIVTCPCVLAFAVPLTLTRALQTAARRGIVFRGPHKIEDLARVKSLFLDKTGTVTNGKFELLEWRQLRGEKEESRRACRALEEKCSHPVAKALMRALPGPSPKAKALREIPGEGIEGLVAGEPWSVRRLEVESAYNLVGVFKSGVKQAEIMLGDSLRPEAKSVVRQLEQMGLEISLLSGDSEPSVASAARALGIDNWRSRLLPDHKAALTSRKKNSAMVGDGANDSVAFQGASVGIAMQGSMELSLKNADVLLTLPGLGSLAEAFRLARGSMRLMRLNFVFTLTYNLVAGGLATAGMMSPLIAAILMPASAATVFAFTFWRTSGGRL